MFVEDLNIMDKKNIKKHYKAYIHICELCKAKPDEKIIELIKDKYERIIECQYIPLYHTDIINVLKYKDDFGNIKIMKHKKDRTEFNYYNEDKTTIFWRPFFRGLGELTVIAKEKPEIEHLTITPNEKIILLPIEFKTDKEYNCLTYERTFEGICEAQLRREDGAAALGHIFTEHLEKDYDNNKTKLRIRTYLRYIDTSINYNIFIYKYPFNVHKVYKIEYSTFKYIIEK